MALSFDGPNKEISVSAVTILSVRELWSRWVDWLLTSDNSKYLFAFDQVGGDDIDPVAGTTIPIFIFLKNGWKIRPEEADHTLNITEGILVVDGGGDPFLDTVGDYVVRINYQQPVQVIGLTLAGGSGLSTEEHDQLMGLPDLTDVESSTVLAKEATVQTISGEVGTLPTLTEIEGSSVLAKEATVSTLPTLADIEASAVLAKQAELLRALGLMQENYYLDQTTYVTYNGVKLLTSGRVRTYSVAGSVGTDNNVLATYLVTASWSDDQLQSYGVAKQ
jgi:hypothetical protein